MFSRFIADFDVYAAEKLRKDSESNAMQTAMPAATTVCVSQIRPSGLWRAPRLPPPCIYPRSHWRLTAAHIVKLVANSVLDQ